MKIFFTIAAILSISFKAKASCSVSAGALTFAGYDASSTLSSMASVNYSCTVLTSFTIKMGAGKGTISQRTMTHGGCSLSYNLYQDSAHLILWGDGTTGLAESILGVSGSVGVFGLLPSGQKVTPGAYSDTVTMTIVF